MRIGKYVAVALLAVLSGCASYPIAKDLREQAQPLSLTQVTANPKTTSGAIVIWGGRIIQTVNNTNGGEIYVIQRPLNRKEKPANDDTTEGGRFIIVSREFLNPATYPQGRLVTAAGQLVGVRNERLQNILYLYPVLNAEQIHVWTNPPKNEYYFPYSAYPDLYWGYFNPLWWGGGVG
ncbi:MAG TPA: Slp family lipoprotein, partial [Verrucomicrobiae bacterium]